MTKRKPLEEKFRNLASKRFYDFILLKIDTKEFDYNEIADVLATSRQGAYNILNNIKNGKQGVTVDQLMAIVKRFRVSPEFFFGMMDVPSTHSMTFAEEETAEYYFVQSDFTIGEKLKSIFEKHQVNIKRYAEDQLKMSEQNLYKILRGAGRPYFDTVLKICDDFGESLEVFRRSPLPKGHLLSQLKTQELLIKSYEDRLQMLEQELLAKRTSA